MSRAPDLREIFAPPDEVIQAASDGDLILFIGAGVSRLLDLPSWPGLAACVLEDLRKAGYLNYSEIDQLKTQDAKKQLSIAKLIADQNRTKLNIQKHLTGKTEDNTVYKHINDMGCTCVTTNYDKLLSPRYTPPTAGKTTAPGPKRVAERDKFFASLLNEPGAVVHLHGCVSEPKTMIVTTKDYLEHYDHDNVQQFLKELFAKKTVVFLGYGLEESEILEHILRRGQVESTKDRRRFSIQGFFLSQRPLYDNLFNYYEKSFGVHLLGFVRDHENYHQLDTILQLWTQHIQVQEPPLVQDAEFINEVLDDG